ncbi:MAG: OmpA family protein [Planctomycetaceae bacterium]
MNIPVRTLHLVVVFAVSIGSSGCLHERFVPADQLAASQLHAQTLYAENQQLISANAEAAQVMAGLDSERQMLAQQLGQTESQLATSNSRIDNLLKERSELKDRYGNLLRNGDPLLTGSPGSAVPGFEFDPVTGLSRFPEDVLFDLGSAELRPEAMPILKKFASTVQSGSARNLRIVIVGHSDDQNIVRPATAAKHPTNWHLSTDRADSVVVQLSHLGVTEERMAAMGYSKFQPLEASTSESSRRRNRRVELYVVPDAGGLAQWDPAKSLR